MRGGHGKTGGAMGMAPHPRPLAVLALFVAVLVAINAADEDLSVQAQAMLRSPPNPN